MIKVENIDVWGFEHAIRGMRNPLNSWDKSDSKWIYNREITMPVDNIDIDVYKYQIGEKDLDLMRRLYKAGTEHRKYLRQIFVSLDITAPLYWWKEMDQYRINVTTNSCSTMHKIAAKEFELDDFSHDHLTVYSEKCLTETINVLNDYRKSFVDNTSDKTLWWQMIQLLPSSYNQKRTITMNYENVMNIIHQRENHKLDEWVELVKIFKELPYIKNIMEE